MKWYEYKAEVDDLHASEELKARLRAGAAGAGACACLLYTSPAAG